MVGVVVGYFVWGHSAKGPPHFPKKFGVDFLPVSKEAKWHFARETVGEPVPLTKEEWELSLDALAEKYPMPKVSDGA